MERWGVLDESSTDGPLAFEYGSGRLSFCLGHGPRSERGRVDSSFPHDALLVLSFTVSVLRLEITYHRPSQHRFVSGGIFRWLHIRNDSHSVISGLRPGLGLVTKN